ncbi:MAG: hypothetical protein K2P99_07010 [Burkholderiales bacterium]|nr:hypothetical protein [Burkholderiales bacterium]
MKKPIIFIIFILGIIIGTIIFLGLKHQKAIQQELLMYENKVTKLNESNIITTFGLPTNKFTVGIQTVIDYDLSYTETDSNPGIGVSSSGKAVTTFSTSQSYNKCILRFIFQKSKQTQYKYNGEGCNSDIILKFYENKL